MRLTLAISLGKLIAFFSRTFNLGSGSAAPGLLALKVDPDLVSKLSKKIPRNIIITGTNGKTTTSRMIAHLASESGLKVIRNHTGSNLERGIASTLISNSSLFTHHSSPSLGVWELDEAAFNSVALKLKPDLVVFLNVSRDQLDRYGEVDSVIRKWSETLGKLPKDTVILLNGDDADILKLKNHFQGKVETFGVEGAKLDFKAKNVKLNGLRGCSFKLDGKNVNIPVPGLYHIYDAIAAIAACSYLQLAINYELLTNFSPAFGRFEKLSFGYIFLIKNPAGATQVFETLAPELKPNDRLLLALNDNLADGTDVSWIWDSEFEKLKQTAPDRGTNVIVSGTRAYDLAVRLKYAGFDPKQITTIPSLNKALQEARKGLQGSLYILPTYTAMLAIQRILVKIGVKRKYWKET